jgi:hypothetical protein
MLRLLERTITLTTRDWSDGTWRYGALLTPQGKIIADFLAKQDKGAIQIDVHADAADDLITRIKRLRLRAAINIDLCTDLIPVTCENGAPDPRHADLPRRILIPAAEQSLATDMIAAQWSRLRLCAGVPEWGADYRAEELFPTDVNMDVMGGIDYRKGCFIGQEVASRMKRKGGIRKRTVRVSGPTVAKGKTLNAPNEIGTITSAEGHDALALVRIDRLARVSEPILCDGEPAELHIPDWLGAEIAAFKGDGNVTV